MVSPSSSHPTRVAVACQGGGSHTAFTAGVLQGLLDCANDDTEFVALSGASGGAICALMAWDGLLRGDRKRGIDQLQRFWRDNTADSLLEAFLNHSIQMAIRLRSIVAMPEVSPYVFPSWSQQQLRAMLERRVDFAAARALAARPGAPQLVVGAVDVLQGAFTTFPGEQLTVDAILASAAVADLFPAVTLDGRAYWDGLFTQNPPIRELTRAQPDEIWLIQVNKHATDHVPVSIDDIHARRHELAGTLSMEQELRFLETINELLRRGMLVNSPYRPIAVRRIVLEWNLDYASRFDRSASFLRSLITHGRECARTFLQARNPADHL